MKAEQKEIGWRFVFWWVLVSFAGWILGSYLAVELWGRSVRHVDLLETLIEAYGDIVSSVLPPTVTGVLVGTSFGITFGVLQWLILRQHITRASWWIVDTVLGLALGAPLAFVAMEVHSMHLVSDIGTVLAMLLAPGTVAGLVQQLTLRRHFERTWFWIVPSALSYPVTSLFITESPIILVVLAGVGLVTGTFTGIILRFILRRRKGTEALSGREQVARKEAGMRLPLDILARTALAVLLFVVVVVASIPLAREYSARRPLLTIKAHTDGVTNLVFSADGELLASASYDGTARLWRTDDGALVRTLAGAGPKAVFTPDGHKIAAPVGPDYLALSPDGKIVASATDNVVKLWNTEDGTLLRTLGEAGQGVAFSPDGLTLASLEISSTVDRPKPVQYWYTLGIWRAADGERLITSDKVPVSGRLGFSNLVFSPDGAIIAAGFSDGVVRLWRAADGELLHTLPKAGHRIAFSPDGKTLATAANEIRFWRVDDGTFLRGVPGYASGMAFSSDGSTLVSSSGRDVRFWRTSNGDLLQTLTKDAGRDETLSIAFSPDLKKMAFGDERGVIRIHMIGR